jgi:hypothetical protein
LHGRGLLGFCGCRQVLTAIQHSKNRAYYIDQKQDNLFFRADYL